MYSYNIKMDIDHNIDQFISSFKLIIEDFSMINSAYNLDNELVKYYNILFDRIKNFKIQRNCFISNYSKFIKTYHIILIQLINNLLNKIDKKYNYNLFNNLIKDINNIIKLFPIDDTTELNNLLKSIQEYLSNTIIDCSSDFEIELDSVDNKIVERKVQGTKCCICYNIVLKLVKVNNSCIHGICEVCYYSSINKLDKCPICRKAIEK